MQQAFLTEGHARLAKLNEAQALLEASLAINSHNAEALLLLGTVRTRQADLLLAKRERELRVFACLFMMSMVATTYYYRRPLNHFLFTPTILPKDPLLHLPRLFLPLLEPNPYL